VCELSLELKPAMIERKEPTNLPFRERLCLPFLLHAQNSDGGWGYRTDSPSSVEPSAWAALALCEEAGRDFDPLHRATQWLRQAQRADGAWPATENQNPGCWVTALACLALREPAEAPDGAILKGLQWLLNTWPAEGSPWRRLMSRWHQRGAVVVRQNHALRGWSWTPGTASWVEPTAYALLLLRNIPERFYPKGAARRKRLAEEMLYDRVCPGGGWNAGNPMVYGVPGEPRIGPTAWASLALLHDMNREESRTSLDWLERNYESISGPGSLALAHLCLRACGRPAPPLESRLGEFYSENHFLQNVVVAAWACLALGSIPAWLQGSSKAENQA
jgi:Squalene-hopene cyclase C-terminal domain